ncbi:MAG TPA: FAD-binding protein [Myxococcales bacterium]|nr:FAD-binding protein [Myxococcales bacterium]
MLWLLTLPALYFVGTFVFDRWLFGGRRLNHAPVRDAGGRWTFRNWGGNVEFHPAVVEAPQTLDELLALVNAHGKAGRRIKPVGGVHSWSACAATDEVCVQMGRLDRVLGHDQARRTITAEAGIQLKDLYLAMDERDLAIASIPNVDTIQLGGAVSNATHGTNFSRGTMSSYVTELQIVLFREGRAQLVTLKRGEPWFEAAVASFGSLGILYSLTLQCEEPYACFVVEHSFPFSHVEGRIEEMARKHYSALFSVATSTGVVRSKIQVPIPRDLVQADSVCLLTQNDLRALKILLWSASPTAKTWLRTRKFLGKLFYNASLGRLGSADMQRKRRREGLMSWRDAELLSRIFAVTATSPWINLEYAIPANRADEACRKLLDLHQKYPVLTSFIMRPVGPDAHGYLSPTRDRPTVYFDIGYHQELLGTGLYDEAEKVLLACEGRCSWSRLFKAPAEVVTRQFPLYPEFIKAKREMDPQNVFSNKFSDDILAPAREALPTAA